MRKLSWCGVPGDDGIKWRSRVLIKIGMGANKRGTHTRLVKIKFCAAIKFISNNLKRFTILTKRYVPQRQGKARTKLNGIIYRWYS